MKALVLRKPDEASVENVPDPVLTDGQILLKVRMVGFCGSDLNSFRGLNPLVSYPRVLGHEVAATVVKNPGPDSDLRIGTDVALCPYTSCGQCASCRKGRANACQFNQTLGVQRDGALTEYIAMPREKLFPARLSTKELCLVEPLTVGFHAVARARMTANDTVAIWGCGGVGLGAVAASVSRGARTICVDVDDEKLALAKAAGGTDTINSARAAARTIAGNDRRPRARCCHRGDWHSSDLPRGSGRGRVHGQGCLHRVRQRISELRNQAVRPKRTRHSRLEKCTNGRFPGCHQASGSAKVSSRTSCQPHRSDRRGCECPAILERESITLSQDHGQSGLRFG